MKKREEFKDLLKKKSKDIIDCLENVANSQKYVDDLQENNKKLV